ncbi:MAG: alpha/beta fold hydrolase [Anaerolineae bacterium]|jgi:pimeloyl-ACP methyl ester carboxylesterase
MQTRNSLLGAIGLLLIAVAVWQLLSASAGLEATTLSAGPVPIRILAPQDSTGAQSPIVLIGHGFSGSRELMLGFALELAHAGYTAAVWDFDGHGANPTPLAYGSGDDSLLTNATAVLDTVKQRQIGDAERFAILGHSMGSGVALRFGQEIPETSATIAVSPVGQPVTPLLPRNLFLIAGSLEAPFVRNAQDRLAEAGGPGGDPSSGTARALLVVPGVEHISILFSPTAHDAAREWLDATFGRQPGARPYVDRRFLWYGAGLLGMVLLSAGAAPLIRDPLETQAVARSLGRRMAALVLGALSATLALALVGRAGVELGGLFGLLIGGYLLLWFCVAGVVGLLVLWIQPPIPRPRSIVAGLLVFATLWLGVGLLGQLVWVHWLLIPQRLALWVVGSVLMIPWFLLVAQVMGKTRIPQRIGWWLAQSVVIVGAIYLAMRLSADLGFLILILPLFPVILGLHALATAPHRSRWAFALSGALFVSWLVLAVFPLQ